MNKNICKENVMFYITLMSGNLILQMNIEHIMKYWRVLRSRVFTFPSIVPVIILLQFILSLGSGLKCYKCNSSENEKCKDTILKEESLLSNCNEDQIFGCIKLVGNEKYIIP